MCCLWGETQFSSFFFSPAVHCCTGRYVLWVCISWQFCIKAPEQTNRWSPKPDRRVMAADEWMWVFNAEQSFGYAFSPFTSSFYSSSHVPSVLLAVLHSFADLCDSVAQAEDETDQGANYSKHYWHDDMNVILDCHKSVPSANRFVILMRRCVSKHLLVSACATEAEREEWEVSRGWNTTQICISKQIEEWGRSHRKMVHNRLNNRRKREERKAESESRQRQLDVPTLRP